MLRNDLITLLAHHDNDTVTVPLNGHAVDIENVTVHDGSIILVLDPEGIRAAVSAVSRENTILIDSHTVT